MKYVLVDIGCLECGEESYVLGIFTNLEYAEQIMKRCKNYQQKHWNGQHSFEIFEVNKENELIDEYYIKALGDKNEN